MSRKDIKYEFSSYSSTTYSLIGLFFSILYLSAVLTALEYYTLWSFKSQLIFIR
jgi:hypothetical protein